MKQQNPENASAKLLKINLVTIKTALPRSTIYQKISEKTFPAPISLGKRSVAWLESEIDAWIEERIEKSRKGEE